MKQAQEVDRIIGTVLRTMRKNMSLTQAVLSEKLGITFQQVQKYETGQNRMAASRLYQVCNIMQISMSTFFEEVETAKHNQGESNV